MIGIRVRRGWRRAPRCSCFILTLILGAGAGPVLAAGAQPIRQFTFGTPESVTRAGFTKVTVNDAFTPEKGYGFESSKGLLAFDRGGAEIALPKDEYTARTYGVYRTTSDLTCALIEGTTNNVFIVALPNGTYSVWLVASDAEWDPPLFEVRANGEKKLDVCIPRASFVFCETFQAQAVDDRLRIELKGPHGWILSGLIIGQDGPELATITSKCERDIFFLTDPELPNWKEIKSTPVNPPLEWTAAEQQKGYVTFPVDYTEGILPDYVPERVRVGKPLTALVTPGEFEPASFCISARRALGHVGIEVSDFKGENTKATIARENVRVGVVRCWPQRESGWGTKGEYRLVPEMIEPLSGRVSELAAGQLRQWWLTVRVPPGTQPGRYRMSLTVRPEKASPSTIEWRLLALPFPLSRPADKHWGTWLESFPPVGGLRGPERRGRNTAAELARLVRADLADYRDHGFDLAIFNYYFGVKENPNGGFTYDISGLARDLEYWKTIGSSTPVAIGCEYTFRNLEYGLAQPGERHVPGTFSPKAHAAIVGLVQHIRDEAQRRGWPTIYFYPIDEPGNNKTENRMLFAQNVLDFVHEAGGKTATTLTASDVQRLGERVDVRIYAYGHYARNKVLQDTRQGHPFWWYANGMFYGHSTVASRGMAGLEFLRSGAEVASAWGFDATRANPYNDFDGGHKDWNVIFPGTDAPIPTIYWELCREGVDDCRYVATLQEEIRRASQEGKTQAARRAGAVLAPLLDPEAPEIENPLAFSRYRWRVAREILFLRGDRKLALPFPAVVDNKPLPEKVGTNLIADPSFEAGPQADGFPVDSYSIADRYATQEQKPVGALRVTDQVAHSGRYSLTWDFGRAPGKGSVYDGRRYLIVNVQVPQAAANQLRGKRVKVAYWIRLGGGAAVSGMTLRQFSDRGFLDGISYTGGLDDPAVWNHFEAEGRLRSDFQNLDIHISCPVPDDPEVAKASVFFIDDVSLHAIEEPALAIQTSLDEYFIGEKLPWCVNASAVNGPIRVQCLMDNRVVFEQTKTPDRGSLSGEFRTDRLRPGIYTLRVTGNPDEVPQSVQRQVLVAPDPFNWSP